VLRLFQALRQPDKNVVVRRQDIELILALWQHRDNTRVGFIQGEGDSA